MTLTFTQGAHHHEDRHHRLDRSALHASHTCVTIHPVDTTIRNLEVSLQAKADNILVFLGIEEQGHPGMQTIGGRLYVDADGDDAVLQELWQETLTRSPLTQSLIRQVPVQVEFRRV